MRHGIVLAALLLPLSGCYVEQPAPNYGYATPEYGAPAYTPDPYAGGEAYPGYGYSGGPPTIIEGGAAVPLVMLGSEWGYYDHERQWHRAPDQVNRHLQEQQHGGWSGHPGGPPRFEGNPQPRYEGRPPEAYHGGPPPGGGRYGGPPPNRPPQAVQPAAVQRPPPQAAPQQHEHEHGRSCPPGQRC